MTPAQANGGLAQVLYDFSGGMESAAMIALCKDDIIQSRAIVRWANTGKQFPEMEASLKQTESICGFPIVRLIPKQTFDEYLFGSLKGILRQGLPRCSIEMKRKALADHAAQFQNIRIALGFNADEADRAEAFSARNDKPNRTFFYPLIERNVDRAESVRVCVKSGFTILVDMYRKMGRFDCFFCPNQRISQAEKVMRFYPGLWREWKDIEKRKGHSILSISALQIEQRASQDDFLNALENKQSCSCFGGQDYDTE